ncbi:MAG: efflux RND transporter periplasmic adaptor subunit [Bacteroidia bacterium]|nr:efflux RND transporter periplasmic adaptor subunit [Bacteroidia bacterium]
MKQRNIIIGLLVLVVVLVGAGMFAKKKGWIGEEEGIKVAVEKAQKRTIVETVSASGKVQPETEVKISADVSGEVVELLVKEGDKVKKGQLLLKVKPDLYISAVERLEASVNTSKATYSNSQSRLTQAQSQFANTEAIFKRNEKLFNEKVISQQEFEASKAQYEVAKAEIVATQQSVDGANFNIKGAQAALKEARENLAKTTIYSPVDGTVSKLNIEEGERVVGTSQMAGTEIMRIANLNEMEVKVDVNESDIVRVHMNDTAEVEVDAYLGRKFKGIVTSIANSANSSSGLAVDQVTNFEVKVRILQESYSDLLKKDQPNLSPFRPGMSATVDIRTQIEKDVLTVPIQAVTTRLDSTALDPEEKTMTENEERGQEVDASGAKASKEVEEEIEEVVFLYKDGKSIKTAVKTGIQDNEYIQIISGLEPGAEVIFAPYNAVSKRLKEGSKVVRTELKDLYTKEKP